MESSPGLCANTPSCALAQSGETVAVPLYDPFVCPSCGAPLAPPALPPARRSRLLPICLAAATLSAVIASAAVWRLTAIQETAIALPQAVLPITPPTRVAATLDTPPTLALEAAPEVAPPPPPAISQPVQMRASVHRAALPVRRHPHARRRTRQALLAPASPAPVQQPASTLALGSFHPKFPDQFYESDWMASVKVDCMIAADGKPSACREDQREGSARFADAVLDWLHNPRTRFQPATRQGRNVAGRRVWEVGFTP